MLSMGIQQELLSLQQHQLLTVLIRETSCSLMMPQYLWVIQLVSQKSAVPADQQHRGILKLQCPIIQQSDCRVMTYRIICMCSHTKEQISSVGSRLSNFLQ
ncbi:hypothetical protein FGO68_gene16418 [Halteria grandinella]|uniref:Uncharacterized protein n=1 Tax=Halteria grandinella TaxID=5974 RepID=A0A8J8P4Z2_HALGN|nr:hypothetical protein FGO68_gene16418 [Halteria grandinella]